MCCHHAGVEGEGWFDPWLLVKALKQKNISLGVKYVTGDVEEFEYTNVTINPADGKYHNTLTNAVVSGFLILFNDQM